MIIPRKKTLSETLSETLSGLCRASANLLGQILDLDRRGADPFGIRLLECLQRIGLLFVGDNLRRLRYWKLRRFDFRRRRCAVSGNCPLRRCWLNSGDNAQIGLALITVQLSWRIRFLILMMIA